MSLLLVVLILRQGSNQLYTLGWYSLVARPEIYFRSSYPNCKAKGSAFEPCLSYLIDFEPRVELAPILS